MAIGLLTAGATAGDVTGSVGQDVADTVNALFNERAKQQQSVILFGDSYAATQGFPAAGETTSLSLHRFILAKLGNAVSVTRNAGVSGNTTAQMLARIGTDVIAYPSDWVFVNGGVNDFYGFSETAATVFANMSSMVNQLIADGRKVALFNCPPQLASRSGFTSAKSLEASKYNKLLQAYAESKIGVILIDIYSELADWTDVTNGAAKVGVLAGDGIHLSTYGEIICADIFMQRTSKVITPDLSLLATPLEAGIAGSEGLFIGTSGSNGTGSSGSVATSYTASRAAGTNGTVVNSKLTRGQRQTFTLSATNADAVFRLSGNLITELTPYIGDTVQASILMRIRTISGGATLKDLVVKLYTANGGTIYQAINGTTNAGFQAISDTAFDTGIILIKLRPLLLEAGINSAGMYFEPRFDSVAGGVVELDIYGVEIREVV